jgi:hypothetical protein
MMGSRRRPRRVIAATSVAAVSLLAPAAAVARTATVPTLGAVNQISSPGTSYSTVRLAAPMLLFQDHGQVKGNYILPGLTVSDPGKFVAVALVADKGVRFSDEPNYLQRPGFLVWRMPTGSTNTISDSGNVDGRTIPAGTYRLTVVATGPERLTWRLPLSRRGASIRTTARVSVPYKIETWTGPTPVISYAMHAPTASVAQLWGSVWVSATDPQHSGGNTSCWYGATDPNAAATENVPGVCEGIGTFGGPVDGVYVPPTFEAASPAPRAGVMTIDATQKVNSDFLPEVGVKQTLYRLGTINAATVFNLWLPVS